MSKIWKLKPHVSEEFCRQFAQFSTLGAQLLYNRGLNDPAHVDTFINPDYSKLHDPFLFREMRKAVERIRLAIEKNESIFIYGDYDADAVTANAVLQQAFRFLGVHVKSYIPDRFTEGYGINVEALAKIRDEGCKVIVTVDTGTNATDAAEFCKQNGIDLIITDHHEIIGSIPEAFALINPKNPADTYPEHEITGVGVAFKLAQALLNPKSSPSGSSLGEIRNSKVVQGTEKWLLDLVAIGTVADCHSLLGENRILVKFGLKVLQKTRWTGLRALLRVAQIDFAQKEPDTYTLGFVVAPRLNAAGRLEHADTALHLLMDEDPTTAQERALNLEQINLRRQQLTERVMSEAREQAIQSQDKKILVLWGEGWPKGIVGLVAGKIAEEFHKPTVVLEKGETESTGSARTVGEFNIVEALKSAADHLVRFGGHTQAAGLTLRTAEFDNFYSKILEYAELHFENSNKTLELEAELKEEDLTFTTTELIKAFEPFGVGNFRPRFLVSGLTVQSLKTVGNAASHLQIGLQKGRTGIAGIAFNMGNYAKILTVGDTVDVAAELIEDGWNGRKTLKLRIVDIKRLS